MNALNTNKARIFRARSFCVAKINANRNSHGLLKYCYSIKKKKEEKKDKDTDSATNRRFPEITGKDNLTVFSYSGRVKSPEWRRQLRRADLRHVLDLQAWTYYNLY